MQCSHGPCTCQVEDIGAYCGPSCRTGVSGVHPDRCHCGHAECEASTGEAS